MNDAIPTADRAPDRHGYALQLFLRVVLLLLVIGQVVYLAGRYRIRKDLTSERLYTLTESTKTVLRNLKDRVVIEAWFSADDKLPQMYAEARREMRNALDEYVQESGGKVFVQYLDPQSEVELGKKAERLGIRATSLQNQGDRQISVTEIFQGLRLMYRGDRQKVIPLFGFAASTYQYESMLTPILKELTVEQKPKVAVLAFPTESGGGGMMMQQQRKQPIGFDRIQSVVKGRYDLQPLDLNEGKLVPDDVATVLLIRPKRLSDRQKYALDQFLMRGGNLVVFADTGEVEIGEQRSMTFTDVAYDAADARLKFLDMLGHYGAKVSEHLVADMVADAQVPFLVPQQTPLGRTFAQLTYPYWLHPVPTDWAQLADRVANAAGNAGGDTAATVEELRKTLKPGVATDHLLVKGMREMVSFFWPCPVDLAEKLPDGVTGTTLMRTSPFAWIEARPTGDVTALNPFGYATTPRAMNEAWQQFEERIVKRMRSEPRRQIGLAVELTGTFPSFFAGKPIPPRKPKVEKPPEPSKDPLAEPLSSDPLKNGDEQAKQDAEAADLLGPKQDDPAVVDEADKDPDPLTVGKPARLVVVGDADFLRDDLTTGAYQQLGGPISAMAPLFFSNLLDVLAEDVDLLELRNKDVVAKQLDFGARAPDESLAQYSQRLKGRVKWIQWTNVLVPPIALLVIWMVVSLVRRAQKQTFLASTGN